MCIIVEYDWCLLRTSDWLLFICGQVCSKLIQSNLVPRKCGMMSSTLSIKSAWFCKAIDSAWVRYNFDEIIYQAYITKISRLLSCGSPRYQAMMHLFAYIDLLFVDCFGSDPFLLYFRVWDPFQRVTDG